MEKLMGKEKPSRCEDDVQEKSKKAIAEEGLRVDPMDLHYSTDGLRPELYNLKDQPRLRKSASLSSLSTTSEDGDGNPPP